MLLTFVTISYESFLILPRALIFNLHCCVVDFLSSKVVYFSVFELKSQRGCLVTTRSNGPGSPAMAANEDLSIFKTIFSKEKTLVKILQPSAVLIHELPLNIYRSSPSSPSSPSLCTERTYVTTFSSVSMAAKLMHAVQYDGYGGGSAGLKVIFIFILFFFY
jgi:hypothetical protein